MLLRLLLTTFAWLALSGTVAAQQVVGVLQVTAPIEGAVVHINYEEVGPTPLTHYLAPGSYTVRVAADGYDPFVRRVTISGNMSTTLAAEMNTGGDTVEFYVRPAGAAISIDGRSVGVAPIRLTGVGEGDHRYTVSHPGHETVKGDFSQSSGGNTLVVQNLASSAGKWSIVTRPEGAEVWMDGERIGSTPLQLTDVPSELHVVTLVHPEHPMVVQTVDTSDGSRGEVDVTLGGVASKVTIKSSDSDAQVSVNGIPLGDGRAVKSELGRGTWQLRVDSPGFKAVNQPIEVPITGRRTFKVELVPTSDPGDSAVAAMPPPWQTWWFWTAVGAGAAGAGATTAVLIVALQPEEQPSGDVQVPLP